MYLGYVCMYVCKCMCVCVSYLMSNYHANDVLFIHLYNTRVDSQSRRLITRLFTTLIRVMRKGGDVMEQLTRRLTRIDAGKD